MTFQKQLHDIIPLLENPLSLIESAKGGCLPPVLHIVSIALLMRPDSETLQNAYRILLKTAIRNKELSVVSVKEYSDLTMEYEQSRNPGKYREPRPPMCIPPPTINGVAYQDTDLLPDSKGVETSQRKMYIVHRDKMKEWLQKENEWPLDKENLLSLWWPQVEVTGDDGGASINKEVNSDRVSVNDLVDALDEDLSPVGGNYIRIGEGKWQIRFRGKDWFPERNYIGVKYIACLVERAYYDEPEIHVSDLVNLVKGNSLSSNKMEYRLTKEQFAEMGIDVVGMEKGLDIMTPEGRKFALDQVKQIAEQIIELEDLGLEKEALNLRNQKEGLEDHVKKSYGLFDEPRKTSDKGDTYRKRISKAVSNALKKMGIAEGDKLAVYLNDHLDMGFFCSFRKDSNITWEVIKK